jgi:hypothetical protein
LIHCGVQEPERVIVLSALVPPLGFIEQVADHSIILHRPAIYRAIVELLHAALTQLAN